MIIKQHGGIVLRKLITALFVIVLFVVVIGAGLFYALGDKIFNEVIDSQIAEVEKAAAQPAADTKAPAPAATDNKAPAVITKEKLEDMKKAVTPTDKVTAAKIVLTELNKSDINQLTQLSTGGITAEEKAEMKEIIYSKLSPQEIDEIKAMYYKYMK